MSQLVFVVRHAERQDAVDKIWVKSALDPNNPELTVNGLEQAYNTGLYLSQFLTNTPPISIFTSPFIRCVQTAESIVQGIQDSYSQLSTDHTPTSSVSSFDDSPNSELNSQPLSNITRYVDYGLSEWQTPSYFFKPPDGPPKVISSAPFSLINPLYPQFPESVAAMRSRYVQTSSNIIQKYGNLGPIIVVTHGNGVQEIVESLCPGVQVPESIKYSCVSHLVWTGVKWEAKSVCIDDHLAN